MKSIDFLEYGGAGEKPLSIVHNGETIDLPDPRRRNYQWVLMALQAEAIPGLPADLPVWKLASIFPRWRAAWDLPTFEDARRLAYLVDHYRPALSSDLVTFASGTDLGELWRERRWTKLIDLIDRLPAHSWYAASVAEDEEHARLMADSLLSRPEAEEGPASGPSLVTWTPEVSMLTNILDAVRHLTHTTAAVQIGQKAGDPPAPAPRPSTALERALKVAKLNRRRARHDALVARVIVQQPPPGDAVD